MLYPNLLVSGLPGSGKSTLIKQLSEIYNKPVMAIGDILRERWRQQYPNQEIPFEQYWPNLPFEQQIRINQDLKERIGQGSIIGDTRYPIIVENDKSHKIFVTAPLEIRVERAFINKGNIQTKDDIRRVLQKREQDESRLGKQLAQDQDYDYRDAKHYHLILDTGKLTVHEEVMAVLSEFTF